jgi:RNA polymerase sigma factor (sigma-70 family)
MAGLDDAVVEAAAAGSRDAVERVYRCLAPRVLGYLRSRGVDDPEGLTDEVFLALIPRLSAVRGGEAGLRTLAFSVAHARVVDEHRRRARQPPCASYEPELDSRVAESAESQALARVSTEGLTGLLGELGEDQRAVVTLRVVADLSLEQTAEVLGRSVGAVKQLQRRGLLRLRELMTGEEGTS